MRKTIAVIISLLLICLFVLFFTKSSVNADSKLSATLSTDSKTITNNMNEVVLYIKIGDFVSDGILGYEATLQYDESIFDNVKMEGLNGWNNPSYDSSTKKFLSTTENAVAGTDIAKITLSLKDNITAQTTEVAINNFIISDGPDNTETLNLQVSYTIQSNANDDDSSLDNNGQSTPEQPTPEPPGTDNEEEPNNPTVPSEEENITDEIPNISENEQNQLPNTGNTETPNANTNSNSNSNSNNTNTLQNENAIIILGGGTNEDITTADGKIPQTGGMSTLVLIGIVVVIGIACYIRYRTIQVK